MADRLAVLTADLLDDYHAKTAHGVIRYGAREVVAVIDWRHAGRSVREVVPFCDSDAPVVATAAEAVALGATRVLVGVAPSGGRLDPAWRAVLLEAIAAGLAVEAGMHEDLGDDPELRAAATEAGVELRQLRVAPADLDVPARDPRPPELRVVQTVGSDVALGKKVAALELDREARSRGMRSVYVPTGQTGIAIAGWGIAVDHVLSDFVAGAAERLVMEGAARGDLLFVEGQGAILHPAYSGVTLGLLHGADPDALVLVHRAGAETIRGYETPIPPLRELAGIYEGLIQPIRPHARVAAIALNTGEVEEDDAARSACAAVEDETGLTCDDAIRFGAGRLLDAVVAALPG